MKNAKIIFVIAIILMLGGLSWLLFSRGDDKAASEQRPYRQAAEPTVRVDVRAAAKDGELPPYDGLAFDDGLRNPVSVLEFELDEFGEGIASVEVFMPDIGDTKIKITRTRHENGTHHFYYDYKIEAGGAGDIFDDITPKNFRTVESAECSLQKIRFVLIPFFQVVKISRSWEESWHNPTMAHKTVYSLSAGRLQLGPAAPLKRICNVAELF